MFTSETYCPKCRSPRIDESAKSGTMLSLYILAVAIVLVVVAVVIKASRIMG
jgi:hypothetical protein